MAARRPISVAEVAYLSCIRVLVERAGMARPEAATAFVVSNSADTNYLVTARHVVTGAQTMTLFFYPGDEGLTLDPPLQHHVADPQAFWRVHPDPSVDIAVADLDPVLRAFARDNTPVFVTPIGCGDIERPPEPREPTFLDPFRHPLPLDEVLIVGYPQDYRDLMTGLPLLRRGRIATPFWLDFAGTAMFLVDVAAQQGSSGGPVFYVQEMQQVGRTMYGDSGQLTLLGIVSEVFPPQTRLQPEMGEPRRPPNIAAAYKAYKLLDLIECEPPADELPEEARAAPRE